MNGSDIRSFLVAVMYVPPETWPVYVGELAAAMGGDATGIRALVDGIYGYDPINGHRGNLNHVFANTAVVCMWVTPDQRSQSEMDKVVAEATEKSSIFGPLDSYRPCATWPTQATVAPHPIHYSGDSQILLLNNTIDPVTPLVNAQNAARQLRNGALIAREAIGHGTLEEHSCAAPVFERYLLTGQASDMSCRDES
ncbi:alpha/beta hydrolase [Nocardia seriolae]|uniref:alpha/beta hydrolase n=1 Tax=Nocardia seriolae TaxID=37332 RepID=UPI0009DE88FC|nr:alpha/beta hydrolase [Nocardia seriolae]MTJ65650.1 hypothetical protein [Nocardia seriolae]MTJ74901.1 hypothetical protein [Nocardia seriolae]MTJ86422.1 hypothetical protein [Nocardia seriolae]MTK30414.1 hypothetical protein [Nocardia seriolae]MTK43644.1 hypothetical protein [Nocardia seriolae]